MLRAIASKWTVRDVQRVNTKTKHSNLHRPGQAARPHARFQRPGHPHERPRIASAVRLSVVLHSR